MTSFYEESYTPNISISESSDRDRSALGFHAPKKPEEKVVKGYSKRELEELTVPITVTEDGIQCAEAMGRSAVESEIEVSDSQYDANKVFDEVERLTDLGYQRKQGRDGVSIIRYPNGTCYLSVRMTKPAKMIEQEQKEAAQKAVEEYRANVALDEKDRLQKLKELARDLKKTDQLESLKAKVLEAADGA